MRRRASARPSWWGMLTVRGVAMRARVPLSSTPCKRPGIERAVQPLGREFRTERRPRRDHRMNTVRAFRMSSVLLGAALSACVQPTPRPADNPAGSAEAHVARARQLAGADLGYLMRLCQPQPAERATPSAAMDDGMRKLIARPAPAPMQVFDNLYFVGGDWVSAWLLKTSDGLILIDALNNAEEAAAVIEGGMARLGLDPRQIKYIVVTHGHGDHYGGAGYLVGKYRPRVVASEAD